MTDDKSKQDNRDRSEVAGGEKYEVDYFARKHGISADQARDLIDQHGNDRAALDLAAPRLSAAGG